MLQKQQAFVSHLFDVFMTVRDGGRGKGCAKQDPGSNILDSHEMLRIEIETDLSKMEESPEVGACLFGLLQTHFCIPESTPSPVL